MKIPRKVNIGGIIYDVKIISGKANNALQQTTNLGNINSEKCLITIEKDVNKQTQEQTFFHEIMHGIEWHFKLDISEENIDRIATGFYQVLRENKLLKE